MPAPKTVCVVPSIRQKSLAEFLTAWAGKGGWDKLILIEDSASKTFQIQPDQVHYHVSHQEIGEILGDAAWIISQRDSACRAFGFLAAYHLGADVVTTLDDDCLPYPGHENWVERHLRALHGQRKWTESIPGQRMRGLPYQTLGTLETVVANAGLWANVADYDSVQTLTKIADGTLGTPYQPPPGSRLIPRGQYTNVCGMNLCFLRQAIPLFYFPLMGLGQPYRRMDDIWAGVLFKKIADHLDWGLTVGEPFITHLRASEAFTNLVKEAPGIRANETFWAVVDSIPLGAETALDCVRELGEGLVVVPPEACGTVDPDYVQKLGKALQVWAGLFISPPQGLLELTA